MNAGRKISRKADVAPSPPLAMSARAAKTPRESENGTTNGHESLTSNERKMKTENINRRIRRRFAMARQAPIDADGCENRLSAIGEAQSVICHFSFVMRFAWLSAIGY